MTSFAKFLQSFKNLKADAVPRHYDEDGDAGTGTEPTTPHIEEEEACKPDDVKKEKNKKKFFFTPNNKKKKSYFGHPKPSAEPESIINTQATGNVINIVNSKDIHWGNVYNMSTNIPEKDQETGEDEPVEKCHLVCLLMESTSKPEHVYLDYIAKNLGKDWHSFFRNLGYTKGRIETVEMDEAKHGVSEARYKLLLDWARNDEDGSLGRLSTLLWDDGQKQIVKDLAVIYNNRANRK